MTVDLSVIVIARNEQRRIAACLDSCIRSIRHAQERQLIRSAEALLVDSASTDDTVKIAQTFPVGILELPGTWPLSAAAGRYVGMRHARGDLVLFVDGDYVLLDDWLPEAIETIRKDAAIGAVAGRDIEESTGKSVIMEYMKQSVESLVGEPEGAPIGLYRRAAVLAAHGFNPFLRGGEDRDLARRMRGAGYRLIRIPREMGIHRWADEGPLDYVTYFKSVASWSVGDGQILRLQRGDPSVWLQTRRRYANARYLQNYLIALLLVAMALINLASAAARLPGPALAIDGAFLCTLVFLKHRHAWSWPELAFQFHVVPYSVVRHAGFVLGFARRRRDPSDYPTGERATKLYRYEL